MDQHKADNCQCHRQNHSVGQSLSELDFDRGIWNAVIYNESDRVRDFIRRGHTMDRDSCNYTALHYAARNGNEAMCRMLLEDGKADANAMTKGGVTALHRAAAMGHLNIVKLLISAKANLELCDGDGETALHRAAAHGQIDVSRYLIEIEPKLKDITDNKDKIPYEYISENANDDFKLLLKPSSSS